MTPVIWKGFYKRRQQHDEQGKGTFEIPVPATLGAGHLRTAVGKVRQNGWTKEGAKEFANIACGYMYAIGDVLEASMKQSKATEIVRGWADEVEEKLGASLE